MAGYLWLALSGWLDSAVSEPSHYAPFANRFVEKRKIPKILFPCGLGQAKETLERGRSGAFLSLLVLLCVQTRRTLSKFRSALCVAT